MRIDTQQAGGTVWTFNAAMREMNSIMDEIERIYAKGTVK